MYRLDIPQKNEYETLINVWESSVRATYHFLKNNDIEFFKRTIQEKDVLNHVSLICARDSNDRIQGFMGIAENNLEMLFIDSAFLGRGIGKLLLLHAIDNFNITKVDVNEQNEKALKFYEHFGFKVISRSEFDGTGKPFPILHMQLQLNFLQ